MALDTDSWLETLQNERDVDKHEEAYSMARNCLQKNSIGEDAASVYQVLLTTVFVRDFRSKNINISDGAVKTFTNCVRNLSFRKEIVEKKCFSVIAGVLFSSASTKILQDCFNELYRQCSVSSLLDHRLLINIFYEAIKASKSMQEIAKLEILNLISRIMNGKLNLVDKTKRQCLELTLIYSVDESEAVRKSSLRVAKSVLLSREDWRCHVVELASCLKLRVIAKLKTLCSSSLLEILTYQCPLYLRVIGINVRKTSSVMNSLLSIIEQGFRNSSLDVKIASFEVWGCLINVFAEDVEVLSSTRYIKLIMQPLSASNTENEISNLKIKLLWLLANRLGNKLPELFNTVCLPMIHSCLGNLDPSRAQQKRSGMDSMKTPIKGRPSGAGLTNVPESINFYSALHACGYRATPRKASNSKKIQVFGIQILIHLLQSATEDNVPPSLFSTFTMKKLDDPVLLNPSTFVSHGQLFITAVSEVLCHMGSEISDSLAEVLWKRLFHHVKANLEANLKKKKRETELFNLLLLTIQNIVAAESLSPKVTFEMVKKFLELPNAVLSSTFYGGSSNGMHGIPAVCLLKLLFRESLIPVLLKESSEITESTDKLISCVFENEMRVLSLTQAVVDILRGFAESLKLNLSDEDNREQIFSLILSVWNKLGSDLNRHLTKSQDVNQGDNLEHDFSAVYSFLMFPLSFVFRSPSFTSTWIKLYKSFLWCGSLVTTCKPNEICQYVSNELLKMLEDEDIVSSQISTLRDITHCMCVSAEFDHEPMEKVSRISLSGAVPSKSRPENTLELDLHKNLEGICKLLRLLLSNTNSTALIESLKHIFTGIHNDKDVRSLFTYFLPIYLNLLQTRQDKETILRDLITSILLSVQKSLLSWVKPDGKIEYLTHPDVINFLSEGFKHKDRKIKQIVTEFWQKAVFETFYHENVCKLLSDEFKNLLYPVYRRLSWSCPWQTENIRRRSFDDLFESSENISQEPGLPINAYGAFGSPVKKHSFLTPKKTGMHPSPMKKTIASPSNAAKRKLNGADEVVKYVKCCSPLRNDIGPLTDHQKEKMNSRSYIPPMYNNLDQDTCGLDQGEADTQMQPAETNNEVFQENSKEDKEVVDYAVMKSREVTKEDGAEKHSLAKSKKLLAVAAEPAPRRSGRTRRPNLSKLSEVETAKQHSDNSEQDEKISAKKMKEKEDDTGEPAKKGKKKKSASTDIKGVRTSSEENTKGKGKKTKLTSLNQQEIIKESLPDKTGSEKSVRDQEEIFEKSSSYKKDDEISGESSYTKDIEMSPEKSKQNPEVAEAPPEIDTTNELEESNDILEGSDQDTSYEYVAIMDASTNQTQCNISIDEEDDDGKTTDECKDLGVSPLDESYEYVAVADMSVNNMTINKSQSLNATYVKEESEMSNTDDDPDKTDLEESRNSDSEYEYVAVADMSANVSVLVSKLDSSKYNASMADERENTDDGENKTVDMEEVGDDLNGQGQDNDKIENFTHSPSTDRVQATEQALTYYISSDEDVADVQDETGIIEEDADSTKEEEDFADASMTKANDSELVDCSTDESMNDADTTDYSEFTDARSSLGAQSCNFDTTGELFDSSVAEIEKSSIDETILVSDASFSECEKSMNDVSSGEDGNAVILGSKSSPGQLDQINESVEHNVDFGAQGLQLADETEPIKEDSESSYDVSSTIQSPENVDYKELDNDNLSTRSAEENADEEIEKEKPIGDTVIRGRNKSPPRKTLKPRALTNLQKNAADSPFESPSAKGILKRRMTIASALPRSPSPTNKRRVSFAEPIFKSVKVDKIANSPRSTMQFRKKQSPKSVNRRLSLPADKNGFQSTDVQVSPLSVRSARVAEAIATIRARENCPTSPSSRRQTFTLTKSRILESNENRKDNTANKDIKNIMSTLQEIGDMKFLSELSTSQNAAILKCVLTATPILYQALEEKLDLPE